jgi:hypothetical protein
VVVVLLLLLVLLLVVVSARVAMAEELSVADTRRERDSVATQVVQSVSHGPMH